MVLLKTEKKEHKKLRDILGIQLVLCLKCIKKKPCYMQNPFTSVSVLLYMLEHDELQS